MSHRFTVTYQDGRSVAVNSDSEASARKHADVLEAQRAEKAKAAGVDVVPAAVASVAQTK